jgi:hypothetical protein
MIDVVDRCDDLLTLMCGAGKIDVALQLQQRGLIAQAAGPALSPKVRTRYHAKATDVHGKLNDGEAFPLADLCFS